MHHLPSFLKLGGNHNINKFHFHIRTLSFHITIKSLRKLDNPLPRIDLKRRNNIKNKVIPALIFPTVIEHYEIRPRLVLTAFRPLISNVDWIIDWIVDYASRCSLNFHIASLFHKIARYASDYCDLPVQEYTLTRQAVPYAWTFLAANTRLSFSKTCFSNIPPYFAASATALSLSLVR